MNEFARQYAAAVGTPKKYARSGRPPLTEKVQALLAFHADTDGYTQPIIADAIEEDGLPFSAEDLEKLRTSPDKLYVHPHGRGYRVLPEPVITMADIRRRSGSYSDTREWRHNPDSRTDRKVHQGPGGTYFVFHTTHGGIDASHVRRFDLRRNMTPIFVHPEGRYGPDVHHTEHHYFHQAMTPEAARALAAHLAEHGRLPEGH